jgi:signal peptidase II
MCQILLRRPVPSALAIAIFVILADQLNKWWTITRTFGTSSADFFSWLMASGEQIVHPAVQVLPSFNLVMVWNKGISFGMLQQQNNLMPTLLSVMALLIAGGFLFWVRQSTTKCITLATGLIVGGALGNVWDRVRFGAVADFYDVYIGSWHWPAFNIADSAISIGVVLFLIKMLQEKPAARVSP